MQRSGMASPLRPPDPGNVQWRAPRRLTIHDLQGRTIATLVDGPIEAGMHGVTWDGSDREGRAVQPGVYFARVECGGEVRGRRITRIRR